MLLPDNIHPELSIYYNGSLILKELKKTSKNSRPIIHYKGRKWHVIFCICIELRLALFNRSGTNY